MSKIANIYSSRVGHDPTADLFYRELSRLYPNLQGVRIERVLRVERSQLELRDMVQLFQLFSYPRAEQSFFTTAFNETDGPTVEIGYQRGWTDPEMPSIEHACKSMDMRALEWARLSTRYQFKGVDWKEAQEIAERYLYNPQSQMILPAGFQWDTLKPQGERKPEQRVDVANMTMDELKKLSGDWRLFLEEYQWKKIQTYYRTQNRPATKTELEKQAAFFGDHCAHTTLQALGLLQDLKKTTLEAKHPLIISAFHDNSGVFEFYDGQAIGIKGETHISPWLLDAIMAILTLHGGVERDSLGTGLGGWPILGTAIFATRDPRMAWNLLRGTIHPKTLVRGAIQATRGYCNPMGIPMGWSQFMIHPRNVKAFALGHIVSTIPTKYAQKGAPRVGDYLVLFGGKTGRDGLHGAVVSGASANSETLVADRAHVQLGFPIVQRTFMEVIPLLRDLGCMTAVTDLGAAGISCGGGEMGAKVKRWISEAGEDLLTSGVWYNLAWVFLKSAAMENWEIDLSESQERMVAAIARDKLSLAIEIFRDYGVEFAVIGVFTDSERCQVVYDADIDHDAWIADPQPIMTDETMAVDLDYYFLDDVPLPHIDVEEPERNLMAFMPELPDVRTTDGGKKWKQLLMDFFGHYNICDQSVAAWQFDKTVQRRTAIQYVGGHDQRMPEDLTVMQPIYGKPYALGVANSLNQFYGEIDPAKQGQLTYAQAIMKLVAAGFNPMEMATCVNVYTPRVTDSPGNAWNLVQLIRHGYIVAETKFGIFVISGKDSSSGTIFLDSIEDPGTKERIDAPLTIDVLAAGRCPDIQRVIRKPFVCPGDNIFLIQPGLVHDALGGSIFLDMFGHRGNALPEMDLDEMLVGMKLYHEACCKVDDLTKVVHSRSAVVDGGVIRRLFEMCYGGNLGCKINLKFIPTYLFSEAPGIIVACQGDEWIRNLPDDYYCYLGEVTREPSIKTSYSGQELFDVSIEDLASQWRRTFKEAIHA